MAGGFIVFEGPEGSGKSTQIRRLADRLRTLGHEVTVTREPGGTPIGERVRAVLLDPQHCAMLPETEALLYAAARAQHVGELIRPTLSRGAFVLCDRFVDSSLAYQSGGRELPLDSVRGIQAMATGGLEPDLKVLLDLPVEEGLARRMGSPETVNRLDLADLAFHERVRTAYRRLVAERPEQWAVVDAGRPADEVEAAIWQSVRERFPLETWMADAEQGRRSG